MFDEFDYGVVPFDSFMGLPSITGGAAGPSRADSGQVSSYVSMNNPFSVAGQGGKANSTAEAAAGTSLDTSTLIFLAIIAAIVLVAK